MAARVAVGLVLLLSGAAKVGQPAWPATARDFGAPAWLAAALPWVEVGLGALLVPGVGLPWTALAAAGVLAAFTVAVAVHVGRGRAVPCGCFGESSGDPVGWDSVVRNLVLLGLALVAARGGGGGAGSAVAGVAGALAFVLQARLRTGARR